MHANTVPVHLPREFVLPSRHCNFPDKFTGNYVTPGMESCHSCLHQITEQNGINVSPLPPMALQPIVDHGLLILDEVSRSHTTMHHSR